MHLLSAFQKASKPSSPGSDTNKKPAAKAAPTKDVTQSHEEKEEKGDYFRSETRRGSYSRTIGLPSDIDAEKAKSSLKEGMLELRMPKVAKSKRRRIKVE